MKVYTTIFFWLLYAPVSLSMQQDITLQDDNNYATLDFLGPFIGAQLPSLKELSARVIWQNPGFITWKKNGDINWGNIPLDLREYILENLPVTPQNVRLALQNALNIDAFDYYQRLLTQLLDMDPVLLLPDFEKKTFSFKTNDARRFELQNSLKSQWKGGFPEILIRYNLQLRNNSDYLEQVVANVPHDIARDTYRGLSLEGGQDYRIWATNLDTAERWQFQPGHEHVITLIKFNKDRNIAVSGDRSGSIWSWNVQTGEGHRIGRHQGPVCGIKFHGDLVGTYSKDKVVRLYNLITGFAVKFLCKDRQQITDIDFDINKPRIEIRMHNHSIGKAYPNRYLSGDLRPEQLIIARAVKILSEQEALPGDISLLKRVLTNEQIAFEPEVQRCFEKFCTHRLSQQN